MNYMLILFLVFISINSVYDYRVLINVLEIKLLIYGIDNTDFAIVVINESDYLIFIDKNNSS